MRPTATARFLVLFGVWLSLHATTLHAASCPPEKLASFDLGFTRDGTLFVPIQIAGQTLNMEVDTGGFESMLTESKVRSLNLPMGTISNYKLTIGRDSITHYAAVSDVTFGGRHIPSMTLMVLPDGHLDPQLGGTIGPDLLRQYGVEFDFAQKKLNLFSSKACEGDPVYWTGQPHSSTPISLWHIGPFTTEIDLDGQKFTAIVETGVARSTIALEAAEKIGFTSDSPQLQVIPELGEGFFRYPIRSLTFQDGPAVADPPVVLIRHDKGKFNEQMNLGLDVLRQFHIFISYGRQRMYMTPASAR
jgi:predicted aspartyl protease